MPAEVEPPTTAQDAISRARRERHPEDIRRFYRQLLSAQLTDLDPELTASQIQSIEAYLSTGSGKEWLDVRDAYDRYFQKLPEAEQARLALRDTELEGDVRNYIKSVVLSPDQLRYFPYGKKHAKDHGTSPGR